MGGCQNDGPISGFGVLQEKEKPSSPAPENECAFLRRV